MKRFFVVDDDKVTRLKVKDMIDNMEKDFEAILFTTGVDLISALLENPPDVIISDIEMPGLNGLELCRKVKSIIDSYIPIILITGKNLSKEEMLEGYEAGCDDYITKPFDSYELYTRLKPILKIKELQNRLLDKNNILEDVVKNRTKELKISRENYLSIFNNTTSGVVPVNEVGEILDCNETILNLLQKDKKDVVGETFKSLFDQISLHWLNQEILDTFDKSTIMFKVNGNNKRIKYVSLIIKLFTYNNKLTYLFILDDITTTIKAYNQLQSMTINLLKLLTQTIEAKDLYTKGHSIRVAVMSTQFARELNLDDNTIDRIKLGSLLHDIGKIGIPERILNKKGKLTDSEYKLIQTHPTIGVKILDNIDYFANIIPIVKGHHEKLNGSGYPDTLHYDEITIEQRIIAISDIYDALTSNRSYRDPLDINSALKILKDMKESELDSELVDFFCEKKIYTILEKDNLEEELYI